MSARPGTNSQPALPVLCEVVRSGFVESRHRGSLVLLDARGEVELALGAVHAPVFPRSSMKPLQAVAMLRAGLDLPEKLLALACASHSGESVHVDLCRAILARAGLGEAALSCPPALPYGEEVAKAVLRAGGGPTRSRHNCSGKHAAMVATCATRGWDVDGYLDPGHELQRTIRAGVEALSGEPVAAVAVDGCGAPQFAFGLSGLAHAFRALAIAEPGTPEQRAAAAMRAHPVVIGGTGRDVSELMSAVPGLVAKDGAEGVYAAALPDGRAMAVKVDDGAMRPLPVLLAGVLRRWGMTGPVIDRWASAPILGGGRQVGEIRLTALTAG
jgi:L-asparaginase II